MMSNEEYPQIEVCQQAPSTSMITDHQAANMIKGNEANSPDEEIDSKGIETQLARYKKKIENDLKANKLPQIFIEELKIAPLDSPESLAFDREMNSLMREAYAYYRQQSELNGIKPNKLLNFDFDKQPIRFAISKSKTPNAYYFNKVTPALVIVTEGLFEHILEKPDDLVFILGHELTHAEIRSNYGENLKPTKEEEETGNMLPLELLHSHPNYNPERALIISKKFAEYSNNRRFGRSPFFEAFDEHVITENRISLMEDYLAVLLQTKGANTTGDSPDFTEDNPIIANVKNAKFEGFCDRFLDDYGYHQLKTVKDKASALLNAFENFEELADSNFTRWLEHLRALDFSSNPEFLNEFTDTLIEKISQLAVNSNTITLAYSTLQEHAKRINKPPAPGRLSELYENFEMFRAAVIDEDNEEIAVYAEEIAYWLDYEISGEKKYLMKLASLIPWPQFELPNSSNIESYLDENNENNSYPELKLPWACLYDIAATDENIMRAAISMGLIQDHNILSLLEKYPDLSCLIIDHFNWSHLSYEGCTPVNESALIFCEIESGDIDFANLSVNDEGVIESYSIPEQEDDIYFAILTKYLEIFSNIIANLMAQQNIDHALIQRVISIYSLIV
ncbi:M48 family metalloprotease, partial [Patescibacteria group bacterium]|nr:M48 family metalloprotease [Patescibacteria group bacterium]